MKGQRGKAKKASAILVQLEEQYARQTVLGRATRISVDGLVVETGEMLPQGSTVIVRFLLPADERPIEAAGRILRVQEGKSVAVAFLGLPRRQWQRVAEYATATYGSATADFLQPQESGFQPRRSGRVSRRLPVIVGWQGDEGYQLQQAAETQVLSKHGALVLLFSPLQAGQLLRVLLPESGRETTARVVWARISKIAGRVEVGLEFMGAEDFWGIEFPPPEPPEKITQRRRGRIPPDISVVMTWVDQSGRQREARVETRLLSKFRVEISSPVELSPGQRIRLRVPLLNREAEATVLWSRPGQSPGCTDLGIEVGGQEDFWRVAFPAPPDFPS